MGISCLGEGFPLAATSWAATPSPERPSLSNSRRWRETAGGINDEPGLLLRASLPQTPGEHSSAGHQLILRLRPLASAHLVFFLPPRHGQPSSSAFLWTADEGIPVSKLRDFVPRARNWNRPGRGSLRCARTNPVDSSGPCYPNASPAGQGFMRS